ncbi:hypothetical protein GGS24DRAFT_498121 [Hypoxylon argillaceum]|nr:hypothetical protein GGS24DRAFT_498121 [Hypoxylon argillaceum]
MLGPASLKPPMRRKGEMPLVLQTLCRGVTGTRCPSFEKYFATLYGDLISESPVSFLLSFPDDYLEGNYLSLENSVAPDDISDDNYLFGG